MSASAPAARGFFCGPHTHLGVGEGVRLRVHSLTHGDHRPITTPKAGGRDESCVGFCRTTV